MLNCELIEKLHNTLINRNDLSVKTAELSNGLFETLKATKGCENKKIDRNDFDEIHESINEIESCLAKLEKEERKEEKDVMIDELNDELFKIK